jgi:hypothetical protein
MSPLFIARFLENLEECYVLSKGTGQRTDFIIPLENPFGHGPLQFVVSEVLERDAAF